MEIVLMQYQWKNIVVIRDREYFFIEKLSDVKDIFLLIYESLSTIYQFNVNLLVQSQFIINSVYIWNGWNV